MKKSLESFYTIVCQRFGDKLLASKFSINQITLDIDSENLIEVCTALRDEEQFSFAQLSDLCGVDYTDFGKADWQTQDTTSTGFSRGVSEGVYDRADGNMPSRFAVVYHLLSIKYNRRLRLRCFMQSDPAQLSSVVDIWASANWYEREAFDLFGIMFTGHPDLRRLLTDYGFIGHPFRKDFPLDGNVEVRYDPDKKRVVYQPVTIKNRVLVPKVIRHVSRHDDDEKHEA